MNKSNGGLKLLISYNINPEDTQEYHQFVLGRYIPIMQTLGFEVVEAWHTAYGNYPNRLLAFVCKDEETLNGLLSNDIWDAMNEQLGEYVTDFSYKAIPYKLGFQI